VGLLAKPQFPVVVSTGTRHRHQRLSLHRAVLAMDGSLGQRYDLHRAQPTYLLLDGPRVLSAWSKCIDGSFWHRLPARGTGVLLRRFQR
jgi:hypothetical protein